MTLLYLVQAWSCLWSRHLEDMLSIFQIIYNIILFSIYYLCQGGYVLGCLSFVFIITLKVCEICMWAGPEQRKKFLYLGKDLDHTQKKKIQIFNHPIYNDFRGYADYNA